MTLTPAQITDALDRVLLEVRQPARYIGGEWNSIVKDWSHVRCRVALAFPDTYELGMSNLGLAILYDGLNKRPDVLAERVYAPWVDMEAVLRREGLPLFSLETRHPLEAFDVIGFSLPYEQLYTNLLNMLDLAGIPLRSRHRSPTDPLILAGGSAMINPEPMWAFLDACFLGEGEEAIHEIVDCHSPMAGGGTTRRASGNAPPFGPHRRRLHPQLLRGPLSRRRYLGRNHAHARVQRRRPGGGCQAYRHRAYLRL